jgi:hypothetical protein
MSEHTRASFPCNVQVIHKPGQGWYLRENGRTMPATRIALVARFGESFVEAADQSPYLWVSFDDDARADVSPSKPADPRDTIGRNATITGGAHAGKRGEVVGYIPPFRPDSPALLVVIIEGTGAVMVGVEHVEPIPPTMPEMQPIATEVRKLEPAAWL